MTKTTLARLHFLMALALAAAALLGPSTLAHADQVGVAAAVHPDAFSILNGGKRTQVNIGKSIFYNERINTSGAGLVQVLLVDGSTLTVGPGSDLVIDKFVYDSEKNKGEVVATLGKGALRFIGGKISKQEGGVTVNTPSGSVAIRGGMFQGKVDNQGSLFSFVFGVEMKFTSTSGDVHRVYEPGYTLDLTGNAPIIRPTRPEDTAFFMKALSGGGQVVVPGSSAPTQDGNPGSIGDTKSNTLASITSTASQNQTTSQIQTPQTDPPQTSGTYNGYGAGVFTQTKSCTPPCTNDQPAGGLGSASPNTQISFDAAQSSVSASVALQVLQQENAGGASINLGGNNNNSVFIDDLNYSASASALANPNSITVYNGDTSGTTTNQLVGSSGTINTASLTGSNPALLCTQCDFLRWGPWTAQLEFQEGGDPTNIKTNTVIANGFWVAGNIIDDLNLPSSGSATYNGQAQGWVASLLTGNLVTYAATGALQMGWNFGTRTGTFSVTGFDAGNISGGLAFGGPMCAAGATSCVTPAAATGSNLFGGPLTSSNAITGGSLTGAAVGSFVSGPNNPISASNPPQGVIGNFNVQNTVYGASGIFAGSR